MKVEWLKRTTVKDYAQRFIDKETQFFSRTVKHKQNSFAVLIAVKNESDELLTGEVENVAAELL